MSVGLYMEMMVHDCEKEKHFSIQKYSWTDMWVTIGLKDSKC